MNDKTIKKILDQNRHKILDDNFNKLVINRLKKDALKKITSQYMDEEMIIFSSVLGLLLTGGMIVLNDYFKQNYKYDSQEILNSVELLSIGAFLFALYFIISNIIDKKMITNSL